MLPMIQGLGVSQQALFVVCRTNRMLALSYEKQPQTLVFSKFVAISDMSFVIFARANVF